MGIIGVDGKTRCFGGEVGKEFYAEYHDKEWGVPSYDDRYLFEMLILEGAQAGLSWETILKRREGYRTLFYDFDPKKVATMHDSELEDVLTDPRIIRNRLKVYTTRENARIFLDIQKEYSSFSEYLWSFVSGKPKINHWTHFEEVPVETKESKKLSTSLKKKGMKFVGPIIMYAYMQAVGMVNDHLTTCFCTQSELLKELL